jgi:hypothetical protein
MKIAFASFLFAGCLLSAFAAPEFKLEGHQLVLPSPIVFKANTAELDETASRPALDHIRQYLAAKAYISKLRIEGHTDSGGDAAAGQQSPAGSRPRELIANASWPSASAAPSRWRTIRHPAARPGIAGSACSTQSSAAAPSAACRPTAAAGSQAIPATDRRVAAGRARRISPVG